MVTQQEELPRSLAPAQAAPFAQQRPALPGACKCLAQGSYGTCYAPYYRASPLRYGPASLHSAAQPPLGRFHA